MEKKRVSNTNSLKELKKYVEPIVKAIKNE